MRAFIRAALTAGCIAGDNGVLKSDMASGWRTYSFALPVTAFEKTAAKYIVKLAAIIIGAVLTFIGSALIHTVGGSNMPSAVMFCYFICLDLFLIIDIVYQAIVLRANDMKSLKKLGTIAGGIGAVILLALEFIPSGVSDSEFEAFMTEVETASSPVMLNKYIGFVTIPDAVGIIGIVFTVVILIAGFIVTLKNHKRRGEITAYSNWSAALAGYIVECVSGMDYAEYLHKNVLEPLGMEQTAVSADYRDNEWVRAQREKAKAYLIMNYPEVGMVMDENLGTAMSFILLYPAGSVTGTLSDITKFAQAFVSDECPLFEKQETLELMLFASDFYGDSDMPKNCHGLWVTEYAVSTMGHGGNTNAGTANLVFDKESKTGVVVVANQQGEGVFCNGIPELIFGSFKNNPIYTNAVINERTDISGNYVLSRGLFEGVTKISSCLGYLRLAQGENQDSYTQGGIPALTRISDNIYMIEGSTDFLCQAKTSDGKTILEYSSMAYIQSDTVAMEFIAVVIFAVIAVVTLVLLIVKSIKKLTRKYRAIPAGKWVLTGQLARLAVGIVLVLLVTAMVSKAVLVIMCIAAGAGAIVCLVSSVFTAKALFTEKEMKIFTRVRYAASVLCNLFTAGFVLYFQLFNFWT